MPHGCYVPGMLVSDGLAHHADSSSSRLHREPTYLSAHHPWLGERKISLMRYVALASAWLCLGLLVTACAMMQVQEFQQAVDHLSQTEVLARWGSPPGSRGRSRGGDAMALCGARPRLGTTGGYSAYQFRLGSSRGMALHAVPLRLRPHAGVKRLDGSSLLNRVDGEPGGDGRAGGDADTTCAGGERRRCGREASEATASGCYDLASMVATHRPRRVSR